MPSRRKWWACLLWTGLAWASAAGLQAQTVSVRDDTQHELRLSRPPERLVSLLPALTETVCALGQCHKLVGVDRYSNWPSAVQALPRLGGGLDFNLEGVLALRPDLVLVAASSPGQQRLRALGVPVLALEPRTHADVQRLLLTLAQVLGLPASHAQRIWRDIESGVSAAAQSLPASARGQKVYVEVGSGPYGASEASFIGQTLARLGQTNILPASLGPFPLIQGEFVVRAQPDVIIASHSSGTDIAQRPGWAQVAAIKTGRVCAFAPAQADVLMRPGPRLAEAAHLMAQCLLTGSGGKP